MLQVYLFIGALLAVTFIVSRRNYIVNKIKQLKFKEEVSKKVDEMQEERQKMQQERFKDVHLKYQNKKRYDFSEYKLLLRKADVAIAKEQWSVAKKLLIQSMSVTKDEKPVSLKLAVVYLESGDLKRAETLFKKLLDSDPQNDTIYGNLAIIYTKKRRFKEAIGAYVQALEINEKDDKKLVGLGKLYQIMMRHSLAAECFKRAAELKPRDVDYLFLLADSCKKDSDYENALFTYERILTLEPYNEKAHTSAQDVRIKMNEIEKIMNQAS